MTKTDEKRLRLALDILCAAHEDIIRGMGMPEDISKDAIIRAAKALSGSR